MQTDQTLRTERLRLRAPRAEDAPRMAELANDLGVARMTVLPYPYGLSDAEHFIGHPSEYLGEGRAFAIEHPEEGLIGVVGMRKSGGAFPTAGYWLGRGYWGRGYATEALEGALQWARDGLGARAVASEHFVDNPASGWVLTKVGFLYTGETAEMRSRARDEAVLARKMIWLA